VCERHETVIIGGGQAGLCVSYYLTRHGREHIVVERGRVAESWRSQRWDGFYLNTPNWTIQLPGSHYRGEDPDLFMPRDDVVTYVERYAESFRAPLRCGVGVSSLTRRSRGGYLLETSGGALEAENVVVATGAFQRPKRMPLARELPARIFQVHASEYRCPAQLPEGAVLVVGSGSSGCQIAEELREHGREVYLSVGSCPWSPRRYRGRDFMRWAMELGLMDETVASSPRAKLACNQSLSGNNGGHDCHPRSLARLGVVLVGRVEAVVRRKIVLRPDLHENLAKIDQFAASFKRQVDQYVWAARLDGFDRSEDADSPEPDDPAATEQIHELDLGRSGIATVLWANGYRSDFRWIRLRLFDAEGWPVQVRGVTASPGLYFVGVHWLYKRKSALLLGVGEDAKYVAGHIVRGSARRD
jgi:putative flavoprotein involved in K+ transport